MKIFRMAIVAMALLSISGLALSQGGLGKKERGNSSGGSSSGGSQNERSRPPAREDPPRRESPPAQRERPPVRDSSPPPSQRERPPVRENNPPPTERERPPVRENTPPPSQRERPPIRENTPPPSERERPPIRENNPPPSQRERPPIKETTPPDPGQGSLGKGRSNGNSGGNSGGNQGRNDPPARNNGGNDRNTGGSDRNTGSDQNRPPLGRIDNPQRGGNDRVGGGNSDIDGNRREGQGALGRSRTGDKPYGTNNNQREQSRDRSPITIGKAPTSVLGGTLEHQVRREDRTREIHNRGYRVGYWGYTNGWNDDLFCFRNYVFDPFGNYRCVASPWYYYPHLPAYLNYSCVRVIQISFGPFQWVNYRWNQPIGYGNYGYSDYSNRYSELDYAVDDIERAFERNDERALGRVMPRRGDVNIWADGRYQYTITADAYYDLMEDNVFSTQTKQYEILSVRTSRGSAEVQARHTYLDPWDRRVTVYHWYRLERERDGYVVRDFGTSDGRW